jgi:hypothetical protein
VTGTPVTYALMHILAAATREYRRQFLDDPAGPAYPGPIVRTPAGTFEPLH